MLCLYGEGGPGFAGPDDERDHDVPTEFSVHQGGVGEVSKSGSFLVRMSAPRKLTRNTQRILFEAKPRLREQVCSLLTPQRG